MPPKDSLPPRRRVGTCAHRLARRCPSKWPSFARTPTDALGTRRGRAMSRTAAVDWLNPAVHKDGFTIGSVNSAENLITP